ncbi:MAG: ATP-binding protein [Magnetococcales bacterium]|nr:ATP-binding protein [Magnetococcales bacterium]
MTPPEQTPALSGSAWQSTVWLFCAIVTIVVVVGKKRVRPIIRAWFAMLLTLKQKWREKQASTSLPSPARFARRLGGVLDFSAPNNRHMARICLAADFPLGISDFFYIRLQKGQTLDKIPLFPEYFVQPTDINGWTNGSGSRPPLVVLVGADAEQRGLLHPFAHHLDRLWVVPDSGEMTRLLLAAQPGQAFAQLLADHLDPALLSPYQTNGPIEKAGLFFGRQPLLEALTQQGRRNHLVMGGQGMGKSSLLRALMRKHENHPIIQCHLFTPEEADVALPLARLLGYTNTTDLEALLDELARFPDRKKPILLIDDADPFVITDGARNWEVLRRLQQLSDAGACHTILAGSWDLQRMLQTPQATRLTEWVDLHALGPLEPDASWQLVRGPMAWINRTWDSGVCLDLIQSSGGRPDWAMGLCHAVLEQLGPQDKTIHQNHLDAAKLSRTVGELFDRWPALLSDHVEENRQDRLVIYSSVAMEPFTHGELLSLLQKKHAPFLTSQQSLTGRLSPGEELQQALDRLEMASLLQKAGGRYYYPSRLLQARIMQQHPEDRLKKALLDH